MDEDTKTPITERQYQSHLIAETDRHTELVRRLEVIEAASALATQERREILAGQRCVRQTWDRFQEEYSPLLRGLKEIDLIGFVKRIEDHIRAWCYFAALIKRVLDVVSRLVTFTSSWAKRLLPILLAVTAGVGTHEIGQRLGWW